MAEKYATQRLDHLGIVAGICQEIGLAEHIDRVLGPTERRVSQHFSPGLCREFPALPPGRRVPPGCTRPR